MLLSSLSFISFTTLEYYRACLHSSVRERTLTIRFYFRFLFRNNPNIIWLWRRFDRTSAIFFTLPSTYAQIVSYLPSEWNEIKMKKKTKRNKNKWHILPNSLQRFLFSFGSHCWLIHSFTRARWLTCLPIHLLLITVILCQWNIHFQWFDDGL